MCIDPAWILKPDKDRGEQTCLKMKERQRGRVRERKKRKRADMSEADRETERERAREREMRRRADMSEAERKTYRERERPRERRRADMSEAIRERIYLGPMTMLCPHCQALRFESEAPNAATVVKPACNY